MKLKFELTPKAYETYKTEVKGNANIPWDQAEKKLNRNILLVQEADPKYTKKKWLTTTYSYGNLKVKVRFNKIIDIENHKGEPTDWHTKPRRYEELSRQLGILDYKKRRNKIKRKSS